MDKSDYHTWRILEEISGNDRLSQRHLADRLGISLGLVNSFIKRLAAKGYFKIQTTPANRFAYVLTTRGFAEKTRLSYQYIAYSYQFYKEARHQLRQRFAAMEAAGVRQVAFCGVTDYAEIAYLSLREADMELAAVADTGESREDFFGHPVVPASRLEESGFDRIIITDIEHRQTIHDELIAAGTPARKIELP